jgi:hypothetical protein
VVVETEGLATTINTFLRVDLVTLTLALIARLPPFPATRCLHLNNTIH